MRSEEKDSQHVLRSPMPWQLRCSRGRTSFREPGNVSVFEAAVENGLVRAVEGEVLLGHAVEKLVWLGDGLLVQLLVGRSVDVRLLVVV